jgi:hypothetical protein
VSNAGQKYQTKPDKNEWSHPIEALEYGIMGAGEGREMGGQKGSGPIGYRRRRAA